MPHLRLHARNAPQPNGSGVWVYHYYYNWTGSNGNANGRYWGMNAGTTAEGVQVAAARYSYDTYANMTYQSFTWQNRYADSNTAFAYDDQNRVTAAYGQGFGWQAWGGLGSLGGAVYGYTAGHPHAVELLNGVDRYDYDANGSMVVRSKGVSGQEQALQWDANNRLAQVVSSSGVTETYRYDEHGQRIRQQVAYSSTVGDTVTYVPFVFYAQAVSAGGSVVTRHYSVNGERRSFALLRPIVDTTAQNRIRDLILEAYQEFEERAALTSVDA